MGATSSHEDDGNNMADTDDSDDDEDIIKMQNGRYRVSFPFCSRCLSAIKKQLRCHDIVHHVYETTNTEFSTFYQIHSDYIYVSCEKRWCVHL